MMGSLFEFISSAEPKHFQPMPPILAFCRILPEKSAINGNVTVNMPIAFAGFRSMDESVKNSLSRLTVNR